MIPYNCEPDKDVEGGWGNPSAEFPLCMLSSRISLQMVKTLRNSFKAGKTREKSFRIQQLKNLLRMLDEKEDEITEAGYRDLRKVTNLQELYIGMHICDKIVTLKYIVHVISAPH